MQLFIPTYRRLEKQTTWNLLPEWLKQQTLLVVHPDEADEHRNRGRRILICPVQGSISRVREWIVKGAKKRGISKIGLLDDDITYLSYSIRPRDHMPGMPWNIQAEDDDWHAALDWVVDNLEEVPIVGWGQRISVPMDIDINSPFRLLWSQFMNLDILPVNEIDWGFVEYSSDFSLLLQLIELGYTNRLSNRYRLIAGTTQSNGGCEAAGRNRKKHNVSIQKLIDRYPRYVRRSYKLSGQGPEWIKVRIYWKKFYQDVQAQISQSRDMI